MALITGICTLGPFLSNAYPFKHFHKFFCWLIIAGTPRSSANCTCASCESRGANDMARMLRDSRYAPQLATCREQRIAPHSVTENQIPMHEWCNQLISQTNRSKCPSQNSHNCWSSSEYEELLLWIIRNGTVRRQSNSTSLHTADTLVNSENLIRQRTNAKDRVGMPICNCCARGIL